MVSQKKKQRYRPTSSDEFIKPEIALNKRGIPLIENMDGSLTAWRRFLAGSSSALEYESPLCAFKAIDTIMEGMNHVRIDPNSFTFMSPVAEVHGKGFKHYKADLS